MGTIPEDLCTFIITATEFIEWEMFQTSVLEEINSHILCSITVFWKLCHLWDIVKTVVEPDRPQITVLYRADVICVLGNLGKKTHTHTHKQTHSLTLIIFNT
jgi:hypothetical protein